MNSNMLEGENSISDTSMVKSRDVMLEIIRQIKLAYEGATHRVNPDD